ncbi:MAG: hypothetical protein B7733_03065 [Myxococcales bacterium FL481]|nr:MAG: hypothetical protein B7733_03065 [Myxococcales bacterium FL481]
MSAKRWMVSLLLAVALWAAATTTVSADVNDGVHWEMETAADRLSIGKMTLVYEPAVEDEARAMLQQLPRVWADLEAALNRDLDDELNVRFVEHAGHVARATHMPHWVAGVAHSSTGDIMLAQHGPDGAPANLAGLLRHELAHVALYRATNGAPLPRWFNEGVADSLAEEIDFGATERLAGAVFGRGVPALDKLDATFREDPQAVAVAYSASRDFVNFLRFRDPTGRAFDQLLFGLRHGKHFETAVLAAYGIGLYELDAEWREGLLGRFAWFPMLSAEGLPVFLVGPLVGLAWWRRRRVLRRAWARLEAEDEAERRFRMESSNSWAWHSP